MQAQSEYAYGTAKNRAYLYGCVFLCCAIPLHLPGIILSGMAWKIAEEYCTVPMAKWTMTYGVISLAIPMVAMPLLIVGGDFMWPGMTITIVGNFIQLGLLIWGAVWFWGEGVSSECKEQMIPLYNYIWVILILGLLGVCCSAGQVKQQHQNHQAPPPPRQPAYHYENL
eukprot:TRINITY_DN14236_c0_g1_i1.p1 TRINITY_DN14236_c0_g1~~TRINITY_DN14236_c0_g1_i1.p1  ORF type:complete len:169 (+),score=10.71 TRINITY_DN14236_c0_g1_i1:143-649(+)